MVPGGRIELPTPAFSGPRSTGELPRHRKKIRILRFYGRAQVLSNRYTDHVSLHFVASLTLEPSQKQESLRPCPSGTVARPTPDLAL